MGQPLSKALSKSAASSASAANASRTAAAARRPPPRPPAPSAAPPDADPRRTTPSPNSATGKVLTDVNPGNFLRGEGLAREDLRDVGQEMYIREARERRSWSTPSTASEMVSVSVPLLQLCVYMVRS